MTKDQFLTKVYPEPNTGCWLWAGRVNKSGYGIGSFHDGKKIQLAHRFSYYLHYNDFDFTKWVLHKCDNPTCVNPEHLYLGDVQQNVRDRDNRGRQKTKRGFEHKLAKFTPEGVSFIRSLHSNSMPSRKLAKIFNCSQKAIMNILNFKSYKNVLHDNS